MIIGVAQRGNSLSAKGTVPVRLASTTTVRNVRELRCGETDEEHQCGGLQHSFVQVGISRGATGKGLNFKEMRA